MRLIFTIIVAVLSIANLTTAQEITGPNGKKERKRTFRLVFPERPNNSPKIAHMFDGKTSQEVYLTSMNFSPVISLSAGDITLYMSPNPISDPETIPAGTPQLNIPKEITDFYIIVTPNLKNKMFPLKMNLVSLVDGKLGLGETLWFNTTKHQIVANLGQSKLSVSPRGQTVTKNPLNDDGYYDAKFGYRAEGEGELARITEQKWWHDQKSRHLGFIVNSGGKLPKIYFFRDFRLEE